MSLVSLRLYFDKKSYTYNQRDIKIIRRKAYKLVYLTAIEAGIIKNRSNVVVEDKPIATRAAYAKDAHSPAPPVPEDHAPIIDLQMITKCYYYTYFTFYILPEVQIVM